MKACELRRLTNFKKIRTNAANLNITTITDVHNVDLETIASQTVRSSNGQVYDWQCYELAIKK